MDRREALQLLGTGVALHLASPNLLAALREVRARSGTQTALRTLNSHQNATVNAIADLMIPRTETPGAVDVAVNQFIDLILSEWFSDEERKRFLNGLADVDASARASFGKEFIECSSVEQSEIMMAMGEQMTREAEAVRYSARRYRGSLPKPDKNFYYMLRSLILTAYYTSEEGATKELRFAVISDRHDGCASSEEAREAKGQS
jgi:gluconate 2-dehydrogenase gamma chain